MLSSDKAAHALAPMARTRRAGHPQVLPLPSFENGNLVPEEADRATNEIQCLLTVLTKDVIQCFV